MENSPNSHNQPQTANKLLRFSIVLLFTISIITVCLGVFLLVHGATTPKTNAWSSLEKSLSAVGGIFLILEALPMLITAICGRRYKKGKSKGKLTASWVWATISLVVYVLLVIYVINNIVVTAETNFKLDGNQPLFYIHTPAIITTLITVLPISLFMVGCYLEQQSPTNTMNQKISKLSQDDSADATSTLSIDSPRIAESITDGQIKNTVKGKNNKLISNYKTLTILAIITLILLVTLPIIIPAISYLSSIAGQDTFVKIEADKGNPLTLNEFNDELWNRGFLYDLPDGITDLVVTDKILAEDPNYDYSREFSVSNGLKNRGDFGEWGNQKFPVYVYDSYVTLIQKSPQTASYYNRGPEDWTISWFIYNINGQTFAAIGEESGLNDKSYGGKDLFETEQRLIVAEEDKITTYNRGGNYFAYGGCIEKTWSTAQRTNIPKMSDQYNSDCAKIKVVDKVDAKTLDALAKEIAEE